MMLNPIQILEAVFALQEANMPKEPAKIGDPKIDAVWAKFVGRMHEAIREAREGLRENGATQSAANSSWEEKR